MTDSVKCYEDSQDKFVITKCMTDLSMSSSMACSGERPVQKPNCLSFNVSFSFKLLYNLLYIILSSIFEKHGRTDIGL